jgi:hypothetical protein
MTAIAICGNVLVFKYFFALPLSSQRALGALFGSLSIVVGLAVLDLLRRGGGRTVAIQAMAGMPGVCILGGAILVSLGLDLVILAACFTAATLLSYVIGTVLWVRARATPKDRK